MILGEISDTKKEGGLLRSVKRFHSNNRRRIATRREICSVTRMGDYELVPHLNKESCDKEKYYRLFSEEEEGPYMFQN